MKRELGVIMDPIGSINTKKDSTLAMLLAAQRRGWRLWYMEVGDLDLTAGAADPRPAMPPATPPAPQTDRQDAAGDDASDHDPARLTAAHRSGAEAATIARMRPLTVRDAITDYFELGPVTTRPLATLEAVLMRKDPPFDMEYIYATYLLEFAAQAGCLVVNAPDTLRDANEKVFTAAFPQCCPPLTVTRHAARLRAFLAEHGDIVLKPLDGMGGRSIFRVRADDPNVGVIIETLTAYGSRFCMAQRFLPEIADGDKRVLLVDGEPVPWVLARIPTGGDSRGNLAAGARAEVRPLSARDRWLAEQVAPALRARGVLFAGLDVIGDWLTEINITSPTCIREIDRERGTDIAGDLMDAIEARLAQRPA